MSLRYTVRPLSDRTWLRPSARTSTRFTASWTDTLDLLERELDFINGRELVLEVDVQEKDIRNDGMLRANAAQIVVPVVEPVAPVEQRWQHNVRAIALTLQALRAVDRYGATQRAEQYQGYKAIGSGAATPMPGAGGMTTDRAYDVIAQHAQAFSFDLVPSGRLHDTLHIAVKRAVRRTHPDVGGRREDYDLVQEAKAHLESIEHLS